MFLMIGLVVPLVGMALVARAAEAPKVGDTAPDFMASASDGSTVKLKDALGKGPVVIYFYPKDDTPGCTQEACSFRDDHEKFQKLGATIYGVSNDTIESHKAFIIKFKLPFLLLVDTKKKISAAYGAGRSGFPSRITFVIGKDGKIAYSNLAVDENIAGQSAELQEVIGKLK